MQCLQWDVRKENSNFLDLADSCFHIVLLSNGIISLCPFVDELKRLPAPEVAVRYYTGDDLYLFGEFTSRLDLSLVFWKLHSSSFTIFKCYLCISLCQMNSRPQDLPILDGQRLVRILIMYMLFLFKSIRNQIRKVDKKMSCFLIPDNLYDVFYNIREDEAEHCKTMKACQTHGNLRSPHSYTDDAFENDEGCVLPQAECEGIADCIKKSIREPPPASKI